MTSIKLTDTQLVLMSAAAQRDDHCLVASQQLRGNAAAKVAAKLIEARYAEEVPAKAGLPVWRRDGEGDTFALKLTAGGLKAIGVEVQQEAEPEAPRQEHDDKFGWSAKTGGLQPVGPDARSPASPPPIGDMSESGSLGGEDEASEAASAQAPSQSAAAPEVDAGRSHGAVAAPRSGTKLDSLIALLVRPQGATLEELTQAVGWLPHTTRAAITGLRKRNYRVSRTREEDRGSVYRIAAAEGEHVADPVSPHSAERHATCRREFHPPDGVRNSFRSEHQLLRAWRSERCELGQHAVLGEPSQIGLVDGGIPRRLYPFARACVQFGRGRNEFRAQSEAAPPRWMIEQNIRCKAAVNTAVNWTIRRRGLDECITRIAAR